MEREYDAQDDLEKSLLLGYATIRERVASGGPGWTPKLPATRIALARKPILKSWTISK
jgi:hypothetical protein